MRDRPSNLFRTTHFSLSRFKRHQNAQCGEDLEDGLEILHARTAESSRDRRGIKRAGLRGDGVAEQRPSPLTPPSE